MRKCKKWVNVDLGGGGGGPLPHYRHRRLLPGPRHHNPRPRHPYPLLHWANTLPPLLPPPLPVAELDIRCIRTVSGLCVLIKIF
jgi:hypothetical protein